MKKILTAILVSALSLNSLVTAPMSADAAGSTYEFENGSIYDTGDNVTSVVTLSGASGGKAVDLKDSGDSVTVNVSAANAGTQQLTIRYSQPYDENGKYQNVIVNGQNAGQILCAHTGEGQFRTVSISANLKAGNNTVTIEGSWGWTYLDSLTVGAASVSAEANPVISRNAPAYSGKSSSASSGNDEKYYSFWNSTPEDYLAYDLSAVPQSQRKKVIAVWYNTSTFDNVGGYVNKSDEPVDYTIEANKAPGGSYPSAGWEVAETVTGNGYSSRQHLVDMDGYNWIRMRVTKANGSRISLNLDIHDASNGVKDSWIFFGDSITAGSMGNAYGTGFAAYVNSMDSRFFPVQQNGGIGGILSSDGASHIDQWLKGSPANYVSIAYGTNDGWNNPGNLDSYYKNTKYMIDAVLKAGKTPILPTIPYSSDPSAGRYTADYNAKVAQLYNEYGSKLLHGPDFYQFFKENPSLLGPDGVHPSSEGYEAMRKLWAETMVREVYSKIQSAPENVRGDVNGDGEFNVSDAVTLQKWLLSAPGTELADWEAGDLCQDGKLNVFDLILMKSALTVEEETPPEQPDDKPEDQPARTEISVLYEAENASAAGNNSVSSEPSASGGKVVGNFADDSDTLTFNVEVPEDGCYCLDIASKGLGGEKINNILVDGENVGSFTSTGDTYTVSAVRSILLEKGKHTVTVGKSWGWIMVDYIRLKTDELLSDSVYDVSDQLIDKNANAETKELFSYLCESYGKYTLAGQVCNDGLNGDEFRSIYAVTGKYPAICGLDFMDYAPSRAARGARSNAVDTAIDFHKQGGISTFCWHWNAPDKYMKPGDTPEGTPRWWGGFNTSNTNFDIAAVMNGQDPEGKALIDADIAEIARQIKRLQDAGVSILWRPLHEASGGWFWWGAKGPDAYKKLWSYLYDQLTNVYGCHNLIWVWNGQSPEWYPGDDLVDVVGEDIYAGEHNYSPQNAKFSEIAEYTGGKKIIALTENGTIPDIDKMVAANSRWAWFGTWCGDFVTKNGTYSETFTDKDMLRKAYSSQYVITLDELPWNN